MISQNRFSQEPKSNAELKDWFFKEWNAKYNVFGKIDIRTHELYRFLVRQSAGKQANWNYAKYVVEKDGTTVEMFGPQSGNYSFLICKRYFKRLKSLS